MHLFSDQEDMKRHMQQVDRALRRETQEKFGLLEIIREYKEELLGKIQDIYNRIGSTAGGTNPVASQPEEVQSLRSEFRELKSAFARLGSNYHTALKFSEVVPTLQNALRSLEV